MNENIIMISEGYDKIDGRTAYKSAIKNITIGMPIMEENKNMQIAVQIWKEKEDGTQQIVIELPIHQVMDLMIFLSRTMMYFQDAYRLPLLYDPNKPMVERIGLQGGTLPVSVCVENPNIDIDIKKFSQALSDLGELTGERIRILYRILEEMEGF